MPFQFDVVFESASLRAQLRKESKPEPPRLIEADFNALLESYHAQFVKRFAETFKLKERGVSDERVAMACATFSNLIGGVGFFSGQSIVQSSADSQPVFYWPAHLYTAVPSRSFFPRGFLWDEGFHNILISEWDATITRDIVAHWLDLMNTEGWIPREVILGDEARAKVPREFWIQNNQYANPPTLFLTISKLLKSYKVHIVEK